MDNAKEAYFGGLPESLFALMVAVLQGKATPGAAGVTGPEAAAALATLVSLTNEEHAAAASMVQVRPIDAVFKAIEIKDLFATVQAAGAGSALITALANLKLELDNLTKFWLGK